MSKISYLTKEGLHSLQKELNYLQSVERPSISKQIAEARDKGDLSENAEYSAAKEAQGLLEMKISKLQDTLINSRLIDMSKIDITKIQILSKVKIKNKKNNIVMTYTIVSEAEANLKQKKISINTPIAKGLIGKNVGDIVNIKVPSGIVPFEIIEISI
ncbi:MAG: transcription elongation factor GreA [Bacteroidetes bacterium 4572_128]|nr:MAG: transcription elongation factor GreA [Bacteroidetes bacterium 4572_128]